MLQDSVPDGSYNDPFLSSVCVCQVFLLNIHLSSKGQKHSQRCCSPVPVQLRAKVYFWKYCRLLSLTCALLLYRSCSYPYLHSFTSVCQALRSPFSPFALPSSAKRSFMRQSLSSGNSKHSAVQNIRGLPARSRRQPRWSHTCTHCTGKRLSTS